MVRRPSRRPGRATDLAVGGGFGVDVYGGEVVRFQGVSVPVDAGQVHNLLPRTFKREQRVTETETHLTLHHQSSVRRQRSHPAWRPAGCGSLVHILNSWLKFQNRNTT